MNFANVKSITIPQGEVKQILKDGVVLWSGDVEIAYTGNMIDEVVTMSGKSYRLLTLTSSGTLTVSDSVAAEVWMCGGGTSGVCCHYNVASSGGGGGGAGAFAASGSVTLSGSTVATIGAGGATRTSHSDPATNLGGATSFGSLTTSTNFKTYNSYYDGSIWTKGIGGGTGGGGSQGASGDGVSKYPFGDTSFFSPHCGGGGQGASVDTNHVFYHGGNGGTNGGNGKWSSDRTTDSSIGGIGGTGGLKGGGAGGTAPAIMSANAGSSATYYGSGGGGGGTSYSARAIRNGGAGYQGVIYIRIPA